MYIMIWLECFAVILTFVPSLPLLQADPSLAKTGTAAMYGMVGKIPDQGIIEEFVVEFFNSVYRLK